MQFPGIERSQDANRDTEDAVSDRPQVKSLDKNSVPKLRVGPDTSTSEMLPPDEVPVSVTSHKVCPQDAHSIRQTGSIACPGHTEVAASFRPSVAAPTIESLPASREVESSTGTECRMHSSTAETCSAVPHCSPVGNRKVPKPDCCKVSSGGAVTSPCGLEEVQRRPVPPKPQQEIKPMCRGAEVTPATDETVQSHSTPEEAMPQHGVSVAQASEAEEPLQGILAAGISGGKVGPHLDMAAETSETEALVPGEAGRPLPSGNLDEFWSPLERAAHAGGQEQTLTPVHGGDVETRAPFWLFSQDKERNRLSPSSTFDTTSYPPSKRHCLDNSAAAVGSEINVLSVPHLAVQPHQLSDGMRQQQLLETNDGEERRENPEAEQPSCARPLVPLVWNVEKAQQLSSQVWRRYSTIKSTFKRDSGAERDTYDLELPDRDILQAVLESLDRQVAALQQETVSMAEQMEESMPLLQAYHTPWWPAPYNTVVRLRGLARSSPADADAMQVEESSVEKSCHQTLAKTKKDADSKPAPQIMQESDQVPGRHASEADFGESMLSSIRTDKAVLKHIIRRHACINSQQRQVGREYMQLNKAWRKAHSSFCAEDDETDIGHDVIRTRHWASTRGLGNRSFAVNRPLMGSEHDITMFAKELEDREKMRQRIATCGARIPAMLLKLQRRSLMPSATFRSMLTTDGKRAFCAGQDVDAACPHLSCNCPRAVEAEQRLIKPWSDMEKCIFLDKFLQYPKNFRKIASYLRQKSRGDVVRYYYDTKQYVNYKALIKESEVRRRSGEGQYTLLIPVVKQVGGIIEYRSHGPAGEAIPLFYPGSDRTYSKFKRPSRRQIAQQTRRLVASSTLTSASQATPSSTTFGLAEMPVAPANFPSAFLPVRSVPLVCISPKDMQLTVPVVEPIANGSSSEGKIVAL